jgi:hypothetical protein
MRWANGRGRIGFYTEWIGSINPMYEQMPLFWTEWR